MLRERIAKATDLANIVFGDLGGRNLFALLSRPVLDHVRLVRHRRIPAQIRDRVIQAVAVQMAAFTTGWSQTNKSLKNQDGAIGSAVRAVIPFDGESKPAILFSWRTL